MTNKYNHQIARVTNPLRGTAPYNFVPLPEKVFVAPTEEQALVNDRYRSDRHTGYLVLKIKTETPMYTRCAYPPNVPVGEDGKPVVTKVRDCQDFFHRGDPNEPVIAGSTLRGMTRSLVEIFSYAKMIDVSDRQLIHRAVGDTTSHGVSYKRRLRNVCAGYLLVKSDGYYINPAIPRSNGTFGRVEQSDLRKLGKGTPHEVFEGYVSATGRNDYGRWIHHSVSLDRTSTETEKVTLLTTGDIDLKHGSTRKSFAIYERDTSRELKISPKLWKLYEEDYEKSHLQSKSLRKLTNDAPLFYLTSKDSNGNDVVEYFGSTMMFRIPYIPTPYNPNDCDPHGISEFIPANLKHDELDLAETIFGRVRQNSSDTRAGRVFFTDALRTNRTEYPFLRNNENDDGRRVPKILASPKPTSFQLYLNQPTVNTKEKSQRGRVETIQNGDSLKSYYNKGETLIRGTKLYWSKKSLAQQNQWEEFTQNSNNSLPRTQITAEGVQIQGEEGVSKQHTIIRPVRPGIELESRVYFENLTALELGALLTALELPPSKRHRLGMGKPLGLGTVEIRPEIFLQNRNPQGDSAPKSRYELLFDAEGKWYSAERSDSRAAADECKRIFRQKMLEHHNSAVSNPQVDSTKDDLTEIPRLKALFNLLEWDGAPENDLTKYLDPNRNPDKDTIRQRYVLPNPQNILERSDSYKYEVKVNEEDDGNSKTNASVNDVTQLTPQILDVQISDDVKRRVKGLRGAGDVNLVPIITQKIESISTSAIKIELAQALKSWLVRNNLWDNPKHLEKRQSIEKILGEG